MKHTVHLQRFVEECATVEVEADTPAEALALARAEAHHVAWATGDTTAIEAAIENWPLIAKVA